MALHESIKIVKVIDEIMIYLMNKGFKKVSIEYEKTEKDTLIHFFVIDPNHTLKDSISNDIYCERDYELEEYGWELLGDDDICGELQQVGMLMDEFKVIEKGDNVQLTFIRKKEKVE